MVFIINNKVYEKDRVAAFCSFIVGLVFFVGLIVYTIAFFSVITLLEQFTKITCQSNILALWVSGFYLLKPTHRYFNTNFLPVISVTLLWFAGLGFWCILFPVYYIDLGSFLVSRSEIRWYHFSFFYVIWNHSVTQIVFLIFFYFLIRKNRFQYLVPVSTKSFLYIVYWYLCTWMIWNVLISTMTEVFPTYGIFTNFNPYTKLTADDPSVNLFSLRSLVYSHLSCAILAFTLTTCFSYLAIKCRATSYYDATSSVLKTTCKPIRGWV